MKRIGLVGGISWVSTIDYYRLINQGINERLGRLEFAECIVYSLNFGEIQRLQWENAEELLFNACMSLKSSGADCIVLCAVTAHQFIEPLEKRVGLPFINIIAEVANAIQSRGLMKVGLLGTKFTMELDFFKNGLLERDIVPIVPPRSDTRDFIQFTLKEELGRGIVREETKRAYITIIEQLVNSGAEGIILGCTELSMIISERDVPVPLFDALKIHSEAAVRFALSPNVMRIL
jgi:aspartate racemase